MASGFHGFVGRDSPRDNPTRVKEGYLLTLLEGLYPSRSVTLPPCKRGLCQRKQICPFFLRESTFCIGTCMFHVEFTLKSNDWQIKA